MAQLLVTDVPVVDGIMDIENYAPDMVYVEPEKEKHEEQNVLSMPEAKITKLEEGKHTKAGEGNEFHQEELEYSAENPITAGSIEVSDLALSSIQSIQYEESDQLKLVRAYVESDGMTIVEAKIQKEQSSPKDIEVEVVGLQDISGLKLELDVLGLEEQNIRCSQVEKFQDKTEFVADKYHERDLDHVELVVPGNDKEHDALYVVEPNASLLDDEGTNFVEDDKLAHDKLESLLKNVSENRVESLVQEEANTNETELLEPDMKSNADLKAIRIVKCKESDDMKLCKEDCISDCLAMEEDDMIKATSAVNDNGVSVVIQEAKDDNKNVFEDHGMIEDKTYIVPQKYFEPEKFSIEFKILNGEAEEDKQKEILVLQDKSNMMQDKKDQNNLEQTDSNGGEEELQVKDKDLVALEVEESELKVTGLVAVSDIELRTTEAIRCEESDRVKLTRDDLESDCSAVHTDKVLRDASLGKNFEESGANLAAADDDKNHIVDWGMKEENSISMQVETIEDKTNFMPEKFSEPEKVYTGCEKLNNEKEEQEENDKINTLKDEKDHNTFEHTDSIKGEVQLPDKDKNLVTSEAEGSVLEVLHSVSLSYAELRSIETLQGEEGDGVKSMEDFLKSDCMIVQANVHNELSTPTNVDVEEVDLQDDETFYIGEPKAVKLEDENETNIEEDDKMVLEEVESPIKNDNKTVLVEVESPVKNVCLETLETERDILSEDEKEMEVGHVNECSEIEVGLMVKKVVNKIELKEADSETKSNADKKPIQILQFEHMDEAEFGADDSKSNCLAVNADNVQRDTSLRKNIEESSASLDGADDEKNDMAYCGMKEANTMSLQVETMEEKTNFTPEKSSVPGKNYTEFEKLNDEGEEEEQNDKIITLKDEKDHNTFEHTYSIGGEVELLVKDENLVMLEAERSVPEVMDIIAVSDAELRLIEHPHCEVTDAVKSAGDYSESDYMILEGNLHNEPSTPTYVRVETADLQDETFYIGEPKATKLEDGDEPNTEKNDKMVVGEVETPMKNVSLESLETTENITSEDENEIKAGHLCESSENDIRFPEKEDTNKIDLEVADSVMEGYDDQKPIKILQWEHMEEAEYGTADSKSDLLTMYADKVQRDASRGMNVEESGASLEGVDGGKNDVANWGVKEGNNLILQVETMEEEINFMSEKFSDPKKFYTRFEKENDKIEEQEENDKSSTLNDKKDENTLEHTDSVGGDVKLLVKDESLVTLEAKASALEVMDLVLVSDVELSSNETLQCEESDGAKSTGDYLEDEPSTPTDVEVEEVDLQDETFYIKEPKVAKLEDEMETNTEEKDKIIVVEVESPVKHLNLETGENIKLEDEKEMEVGHLNKSRGNEMEFLVKEDAKITELAQTNLDIKNSANQRAIQNIQCINMDEAEFVTDDLKSDCLAMHADNVQRDASLTKNIEESSASLEGADDEKNNMADYRMEVGNTMSLQVVTMKGKTNFMLENSSVQENDNTGFETLNDKREEQVKNIKLNPLKDENNHNTFEHTYLIEGNVELHVKDEKLVTLETEGSELEVMDIVLVSDAGLRLMEPPPCEEIDAMKSTGDFSESHFLILEANVHNEPSTSTDDVVEAADLQDETFYIEEPKEAKLADENDKMVTVEMESLVKNLSLELLESEKNVMLEYEKEMKVGHVGQSDENDVGLLVEEDAKKIKLEEADSDIKSNVDKKAFQILQCEYMDEAKFGTVDSKSNYLAVHEDNVQREASLTNNVQESSASLDSADDEKNDIADCGMKERNTMSLQVGMMEENTNFIQVQSSGLTKDCTRFEKLNDEREEEEKNDKTNTLKEEKDHNTFEHTYSIGEGVELLVKHENLVTLEAEGSVLEVMDTILVSHAELRLMEPPQCEEIDAMKSTGDYLESYCTILEANVQNKSSTPTNFEVEVTDLQDETLYIGEPKASKLENHSEPNTEKNDKMVVVEVESPLKNVCLGSMETREYITLEEKEMDVGHLGASSGNDFQFLKKEDTHKIELVEANSSITCNDDQKPIKKLQWEHMEEAKLGTTERSALEVMNSVLGSDVELSSIETLQCEESDRAKLTRDYLERDCVIVEANVQDEPSTPTDVEVEEVDLQDETSYIGEFKDAKLEDEKETISEEINKMVAVEVESSVNKLCLETTENITLEDEKQMGVGHLDKSSGDEVFSVKELTNKSELVHADLDINNNSEQKAIQNLQCIKIDEAKLVAVDSKSDCLAVHAGNVEVDASMTKNIEESGACLEGADNSKNDVVDFKMKEGNNMSSQGETMEEKTNFMLEKYSVSEKDYKRSKKLNDVEEEQEENDKTSTLKEEKDHNTFEHAYSIKGEVELLMKDVTLVTLEVEGSALNILDSALVSDDALRLMETPQCEQSEEVKLTGNYLESNCVTEEANVDNKPSTPIDVEVEVTNLQDQMLCIGEHKAAKLEDQNEPNTKENNKMVGVVVDSPEKHTSLETLETREHVTSEDEEEIDVGHLGESSGNDTGFLDKEDTNKIELQEADSGIQCNDDQKQIKILLWEHMVEAELGTAEGSTLEVTDSVLVSDVELSSIETVQCEESDGAKSTEDYFESDCMMEQANVQDESSTPTYVEVEEVDLPDETSYIGDPNSAKLEDEKQTVTEENDKMVIVKVESSVKNLSLEVAENITLEDEKEMEVGNLGKSSGDEVFPVKEDANITELAQAGSDIKKKSGQKAIQNPQCIEMDEAEFVTVDSKSDCLAVNSGSVQIDASLTENIEESVASLEGADDAKNVVVGCWMKAGNTMSMQVEMMEKTNFMHEKSSVPENIYTIFEQMNDEGGEEEAKEKTNTLKDVKDHYTFDHTNSIGGEMELLVKDENLVTLGAEGSALDFLDSVLMSDTELRFVEPLQYEESDGVELTGDYSKSDCVIVDANVHNEPSTPIDVEVEATDLQDETFYIGHPKVAKLEDENETNTKENNKMVGVEVDSPLKNISLETMQTRKNVILEDEEEIEVDHLNESSGNEVGFIGGEVDLLVEDENLVTLGAEESALEVMDSVSVSYAELRSIKTFRCEESDGVKSTKDYLESDCMIVPSDVHYELSSPRNVEVEEVDLRDETFYIGETKAAKLEEKNETNTKEDDKMVLVEVELPVKNEDKTDLVELESFVKNVSLETFGTEENTMSEYVKEMEVEHFDESNENDLGFLVKEDAQNIELEEINSDKKSNADKMSIQILQLEHIDETEFGTDESKSDCLSVHLGKLQRDASGRNNVEESGASLDSANNEKIDMADHGMKEGNTVSLQVDMMEVKTNFMPKKCTVPEKDYTGFENLNNEGEEQEENDKSNTLKDEKYHNTFELKDSVGEEVELRVKGENLVTLETEGSALEVMDSILVSGVKLRLIEPLQCEDSDGVELMEDYSESDCMIENANVNNESSTPIDVEVETTDIQDETFYIGEPKTSKLEEGNKNNTEENDKIVVVEVEPPVNNLSSETLETRENITTKDEEEMEVGHLNESSGIEVGFLVKEDTNKIKLLEADLYIKSNADKKDIQILQYEHTDESEFGTNDQKSDSLFVHVDMVQRDASLGTNIEECGASLEAADNEKKDMTDCGMKEGNTTSLQVETMEEKTKLISKKSSVPEKVYTGFEKLNDEAKEQEGNNRSNTLEHGKDNNTFEHMNSIRGEVEWLEKDDNLVTLLTEGSALEVMDSVSVSDDELGSIETLKCEESDGVKMTRDYLESDCLQVEATLKNEASTPTDVEVETVDLQHDKFYKREPIATKLEDENETIVDENTVFTEEGIPMENVSLKTIETGEIIMSEDKEDNKVGHIKPSGNEAGLIEKEDANGIEFKNVESDIRSNVDQKDIQILHCEYVDKETNFTSKKFNKLEKVYIEFKKLNDEVEEEKNDKSNIPKEKEDRFTFGHTEGSVHEVMQSVLVSDADLRSIETLQCEESNGVKSTGDYLESGCIIVETNVCNEPLAPKDVEGEVVDLQDETFYIGEPKDSKSEDHNENNTEEEDKMVFAEVESPVKIDDEMVLADVESPMKNVSLETLKTEENIMLEDEREKNTSEHTDLICAEVELLVIDENLVTLEAEGRTLEIIESVLISDVELRSIETLQCEDSDGAKSTENYSESDHLIVEANVHIEPSIPTDVDVEAVDLQDDTVYVGEPRDAKLVGENKIKMEEDDMMVLAEVKSPVKNVSLETLEAEKDILSEDKEHMEVEHVQSHENETGFIVKEVNKIEFEEADSDVRSDADQKAIQNFQFEHMDEAEFGIEDLNSDCLTMHEDKLERDASRGKNLEGSVASIESVDDDKNDKADCGMKEGNTISLQVETTEHNTSFMSEKSNKPEKVHTGFEKLNDEVEEQEENGKSNTLKDQKENNTCEYTDSIGGEVNLLVIDENLVTFEEERSVLEVIESFSVSDAELISIETLDCEQSEGVKLARDFSKSDWMIIEAKEYNEPSTQMDVEVETVDLEDETFHLRELRASKSEHDNETIIEEDDKLILADVESSMKNVTLETLETEKNTMLEDEEEMEVGHVVDSCENKVVCLVKEGANKIEFEETIQIVQHVEEKTNFVLEKSSVPEKVFTEFEKLNDEVEEHVENDKNIILKNKKGRNTFEHTNKIGGDIQLLVKDKNIVTMEAERNELEVANSVVVSDLELRSIESFQCEENDGMKLTRNYLESDCMILETNVHEESSTPSDVEVEAVNLQDDTFHIRESTAAKLDDENKTNTENISVVMPNKLQKDVKLSLGKKIVSEISRKPINEYVVLSSEQAMEGDKKIELDANTEGNIVRNDIEMVTHNCEICDNCANTMEEDTNGSSHNSPTHVLDSSNTLIYIIKEAITGDEEGIDSSILVRDLQHVASGSHGGNMCPKYFRSSESNSSSRTCISSYNDNKMEYNFTDMTVTKKDKKLHQKLELITEKFLNLLSRMGANTMDFNLDHHHHKSSQQYHDNQKDLSFSCNILVLGKIGVGKSTVINSIMGEEKNKINAFDGATTNVRLVSSVVDSIKVNIIDTPGLRTNVMDQGWNKKILSTVNSYTKKCPPDIILYVDRLDSWSNHFDDIPLLKTITTILGTSIWVNTIVTFTHADSIPPDNSNGDPLTYETFIAQRSHIVQQSIQQATGDMCLINAFSFVENYPYCKRNCQGKKVLPTIQNWRKYLLILCYSTKPKYQPKASINHKGLKEDSSIEVDDYSEVCDDEYEYGPLPTLWPLMKAQFDELMKDKNKDECAYHVKLIQGMQFNGVTQGSMPCDNDLNPLQKNRMSPILNMVIEPSFDFDDPPTHQYNLLEPTSIITRKHVLGAHTWDHEYNFDGASLEKTLVLHKPTKCFEATLVEFSKDMKKSRIHFNSSFRSKHVDDASHCLGYNIQKAWKKLAYCIWGETTTKDTKHKTVGGLSVMFLGDTMLTGVKIEDYISVGESLALLSQYLLRRHSKMALHIGLNTLRTGQINLKMSTSKMVQIALLGLVPLATSMYKSFVHSVEHN
uniref:AIG1-type G domain-containing protein n=1 Tax=Oryza barthii TaxID=65489 RepID=A0A0D3ENM8_9ORYZ